MITAVFCTEVIVFAGSSTTYCVKAVLKRPLLRCACEVFSSWLDLDLLLSSDGLESSFSLFQAMCALLSLIAKKMTTTRRPQIRHVTSKTSNDEFSWSFLCMFKPKFPVVLLPMLSMVMFSVVSGEYVQPLVLRCGSVGPVTGI